MRRALALVGSAALAASLSIAAACGESLTTEEPGDRIGADATTPGADGASVDGAADASPDAPATPDAGVPEGMVAVGPFYVDKTEVTNAAYDAFLTAMLASPDAGAYVHEDCAANTTFTRGCTSSTNPEHPVSCVDWCDAWAYCAWAGKRLCGAITGGPLVSADATDPTKSQWMLACAGVSNRSYPYGNTTDLYACRTSATGPIDAGSLPTCSDGDGGPLDLTGNVSEWEDACKDGGTRPLDYCRFRGGSYANAAVNATCTYANEVQRSAHDAQIGFRCCYP